MPKNNKKLKILLLIFALLVSLFVIYFASPPEIGTVLTITYCDGTTKQINTSDPWHRLTSFFGEGAIQTTGGTPINSIKVECYITPTFSGSEVDHYTVSGSFQMKIQKSTSPYTVVYTSPVMPISPLNPTLQSGRSVVIASATISSSNIQSLYSGWEGGKTYSIQYINTSPITVTIYFKDGSVITRSATAPTVSYVFKYV